MVAVIFMGNKYHVFISAIMKPDSVVLLFSVLFSTCRFLKYRFCKPLKFDGSAYCSRFGLCEKVYTFVVSKCNLNAY